MRRVCLSVVLGWAVVAVCVFSATAMAREAVMDLKIGDGSGWSFSRTQFDKSKESDASFARLMKDEDLKPKWSENRQGVTKSPAAAWQTQGPAFFEDGVIIPPDQRNLHSRAFYKAKAFKDMTVEFEFNGNYRENGTGNAGLILRATDPNHFYFVHFPWGGQQLRAKHFWAAVAKVQGDGYLRNLKMAWVPGVPSETDRWYKVRVEVKGPQINVWVDGRHALSVTDSTYKSGCVGLGGYGMYYFRNVRVSGTAVRPPAWKDRAEIPTHSFTVGLDSQNMPTGCVAPNGDVLLAAGSLIVRSKDKGRTWSKPAEVKLPETLRSLSDYGCTMFRTAKGRLIIMFYAGGAPPKISISESMDSGETWSDPVESKVEPKGWETNTNNLGPYGPLVETENGTLLRFLLARTSDVSKFTNVVTWGSTHCKAFAIRSTDGGNSWSAPIEIDQPNWTGQARGSIPGSLDLTEPTGIAMGNVVTVLIRPVYSPSMWQCWSKDAGATWDSAARATFPGYAQSVVRTRSGAILCAHRYPHYSVNISRDGGLNWDDGTVIDYPAWAMGNMIEVEPDVVLCTYMSWFWDRNGQPLLAQLIKVTPEGIKPISGTQALK